MKSKSEDASHLPALIFNILLISLVYFPKLWPLLQPLQFRFAPWQSWWSGRGEQFPGGDDTGAACCVIRVQVLKWGVRILMYIWHCLSIPHTPSWADDECCVSDPWYPICHSCPGCVLNLQLFADCGNLQCHPPTEPLASIAHVKQSISRHHGRPTLLI